MFDLEDSVSMAEKDAARMRDADVRKYLQPLSLFYIPIKVKLEDSQSFDTVIQASIG